MADTAGGPKATDSRAASSISVGTGAPEIKQAPKARDVLTINHGKCIDCGFCHQSCVYGVVFTTFTRQHHYQIHPETCAWCGGPGRAPCEVYCPVPGAIVPAKYDPVSGVVSSARTGLSMPVHSVLLPAD
ncbi:MAG: ferredoxin family protein [Candidatus Binatia bacterium]